MKSVLPVTLFPLRTGKEEWHPFDPGEGAVLTEGQHRYAPTYSIPHAGVLGWKSRSTPRPY